MTIAQPDALPTRKVVPWLLIALALFVLGSIWLGLSLGRGTATRADLQKVYATMRTYRTCAAFLAGAGMAVGGVVVQGLFRNPLASPSTLGATAGSTLGGQLALVVSVVYLDNVFPAGVAREMAIPVGCLIGAVCALGVLLSIMSSQASVIALVLAGFVLESLFASMGSLLPYFYQDSWQLARALGELGSGSLAGAGMRHVALGAVLVLGGTLPALLMAPTLDVLTSGEEEARALGVDVPAARFWSVVWASTLTAGAVSIGGSVLFVGLIVPHALRPLVGERHAALIPASFFAGGAVLILCDVVCRVVPSPGEMPLSLITGVLGAPIFLWMLRSLYVKGRHD